MKDCKDVGASNFGTGIELCPNRRGNVGIEKGRCRRTCEIGGQGVDANVFNRLVQRRCVKRRGGRAWWMGLK